ncbi:hypothetical protein ABKN59_006610 [Abortiporus biennis]
MEYDRKSGVSSFYGGRRPSADMLNNDPSTSQYGTQPRARQDSASSFYNPNGPSRASAEMLGHQPPPGAGYNRMSYFEQGRQEPVKGVYDAEQDETAPFKDEPFDIYADFNNSGPRYSTAFTSNAFTANNDGYRQVPSPTFQKHEDISSPTGPVEMVTVPALGPEWNKDEMRQMTRKGRGEAGRERRAQKWKEWKRGERGMCGRYFTRKFTAWFLFGLCVAIGIILAFTIPRVPGFQFNSDTPLISANGTFNASIPTQFSRTPANFSFPAYADLKVDTGSRQVGSGDSGALTLPAKSFPIVNLPLNFTYVATNDTDQTWANWHSACINKALDTDGRPPLQFRLLISMDIVGLPGKHNDGTQVTNAPCPIELPMTAP